jgi:hypothetical protein
MQQSKTALKTETFEQAPPKIVHLSGSYEAFGMVMDYLSRSELYTGFELGNLSKAIRRQLRLGHHVAAVLGDQMVGYAGWLITSREIAEAWKEGKGVLKTDPNGKADAAALTIVAVTDPRATPGLIRRARQLNPGTRVYFKREYQDAALRGARKASVLNFGPARAPEPNS